MKVTILQTDIQWANPQENMAHAEALMSQQPDADLYVLPEMWATGFATDPQGIPLDDNAPMEWMQRMAKHHSCAVCGSLLIRLDDGSLRNRHYFAHPDGRIDYYDKHHLFTYGHEDRYIVPGNDHVVVSYGGVRILLLTCYDLRFPLWSRYGLAGDYDMIVVVANWPDSRQQAWRYLTHARAIENQCYLVGCNRVGDDRFCHYTGESLVCDSKGDTLLLLGDKEEAKSVELDFASLQYVREHFRVLNDRDK